jgi:hypothetical protein
MYLDDLVRPTNNQTIRTNNQTNRGIGWDFECEQGGKRKRHCVTMIKEAQQLDGGWNFTDGAYIDKT